MRRIMMDKRHRLFAALALLLLTLSASSATSSEVPRPNIPDRTFTISDFGAVPDGATLNTASIAKAIAACEKAGGGTVVIPAGKFLTAAFTLTNNLNLHLDKGATLLLSNRFDDYKRAGKGGYENIISADNMHDIAITGDGTIDGQGQPWWDEFLKTKNAPADAPHLPHRPFMVAIRNCTRVLVQGVTLTNSPMFHLVPGSCHDVTIDGVKFIAPAKAPNTDALDPSGWNFLITHCTFDVGDDCIAIKATGKGEDGHLSCEDFLVTDCTFKHGHGMSIGGQTPGGLRRLVVRNSTFENTDAGIRLKANRGSGGLVEDCVYENLTMKNVKVPIYITSYYPENGTPKTAAADPGKPVNDLTPIWRNIRINNVTADSCPTAGKIIGVPEMPVTDIVLTNVKIAAEKPMSIWNAKDIRFVNSRVKVEREPALDLQNAQVTGIDPKTGNPQ
jgi:polygalacturonase